MEDAMFQTDTNTLYVLAFSLLATMISLSAVWYATAATYVA
jgi:hypothetical protein